MVRPSSTVSGRSLKSGKENMRQSPRKSPRKSQQSRRPFKGARRNKKEAGNASGESGDSSSNRGVQASSMNKQQKAKKRLSLWRRSSKEQSQVIGTDDLRELLDVVTTRMRATEGLMGQPLQEEQLVSIVRDVLQSRPEADCVSTLSGSLSKCDEYSGIAASADSGETSLQQLVVVLMTLLLQHRKLPEVAAPSKGVPTVVLTTFEDNMSQASPKKSTLTDRVEGKDMDTISVSEVSAILENTSLQSKKSIAMVEVTEESENNEECDVSAHKASENAEGQDGVEYTIEELQGVLTMIRAARGRDDDESTVWSTTSKLDTSMIEDPSTMDSMLDMLITILPDSFGLSPIMDVYLDPLEEESDSDNDGDETTVFNDVLIKRGHNEDADTNYDDCTTEAGAGSNDGATDDKPPSSFFVNLWGSGTSCQSDADILEEDTAKTGHPGSPVKVVSINRNSEKAVGVSEDVKLENDDAQSGFFSGIFGNDATTGKEIESAAPTREAIEEENIAETDATFLGAVFGTSVAAIFNGVQTEKKHESLVKVKGDKSMASQPSVNDRNGITVDQTQPLPGLFDATEGDSSQSDGSTFEGTDDSFEETVTTLSDEDTPEQCDTQLVGSEVMIEESETLEEHLHGIAFNDSGQGTRAPQSIFDNLCQPSSRIRSHSLNNSHDEDCTESFLRRVKSLDDEHAVATEKRELKHVATASLNPIDVPGVHSDHEMVSIPLSLDESESLGTSVKDLREYAWDGDMEYPADEVSECKSSDAGGSVTSKKNKLTKMASSILHQYKSEKLSKRSNSDLSMKSGGSMSWKSAVSRTASFASSIGSRKSSVVKKEMRKPAPDLAAAKSNTEEDPSSPHVVRVVQSGQDDAEKVNYDSSVRPFDELNNLGFSKDDDDRTSIVDDAKRDLDDSTEAAWDRLELPLEVSNRIAPEPKRIIPAKGNRAGFSRWMSRRARQPAVQRITAEPHSKTLDKANLNRAATSASSPPTNPRQKRRQHRKGHFESEESCVRKKSENPVVNLSGTTAPQDNDQLQSVESQAQNQHLVHIQVVQNHVELSFTLDDDEANEVQSTSDLSVVRLDRPDSQWNEQWYTNYMEGGNTADAPSSNAQRKQPNKAPAQGLSKDRCSNTSAESLMSSESDNVNSLVGAVDEEPRATKSNNWQSFSNSPFEESSSVQAPKSERAASSGQGGVLHGRSATAKSTKVPKSILRNKKKNAENSSSKREFESCRSQKAVEREKSADRLSKSQLFDGTDLRIKTPTQHSSQESKTIVNVKQRAREFAQRASSRSALKQEEVATRRDPTPQRSNVTEQWKFFNPDAAPGKKPTGGLIRGRNLVVDPPMKSGHKSSPSAVNEAINAFEGNGFSQFGDASGFDGDMSFPPF